jgi:putative ABC transport system substrate-binding protein
VTTWGAELGGAKRLELLRELVPRATEIALLMNPNNPGSEAISKGVQEVASNGGLGLHILYASAELDFENVFETVLRLRLGAIVIGPDPLLISRGEQIAALALRHGVPAIYQFSEFAEAGGVMSYGGNLTEPFLTLLARADEVIL